MYLDRLCPLAFLSLTGVTVGSMAKGGGGVEHIPVQSGEGQAKRPRFILGKGEGIDLSISYDSFFGKGESKLNKKLGFKDVTMYWGNHRVWWGDTFCDLEQNGNYFLNKGGTSTCKKGWFWPSPKTEVKLPVLSVVGSAPSKNSSVSDLYINSCSFTLSEDPRGAIPKKWKMTMSDCKTKWFVHHSDVAPITFDVEYEVN